ncbi:MAG: hypothetical protein DMD55_20125 [Gemmatimonadetes bacterium]|nr:MAG: hypothetical protein DMD55_20125 [Gemmatimonadota bacterium]
MVTLRQQGFSHREIAQKVARSERTVRRYTNGVSPQLQLPTTPKRVDVLVACTKVILELRGRLELDTAEVDVVLKALRKTLDQKDPLTLEWLGTDSHARGDFLVDEVLRKVMPGINTMRHIRRIREQLRACGSEVVGEEPAEGPAPFGDRPPPG